MPFWSAVAAPVDAAGVGAAEAICMDAGGGACWAPTVAMAVAVGGGAGATAATKVPGATSGMVKVLPALSFALVLTRLVVASACGVTPNSSDTVTIVSPAFTR